MESVGGGHLRCGQTWVTTQQSVWRFVPKHPIRTTAATSEPSVEFSSVSSSLSCLPGRIPAFRLEMLFSLLTPPEAVSTKKDELLEDAGP